jgi:hypothetical protein
MGRKPTAIQELMMFCREKVFKWLVHQLVTREAIDNVG